MVYLLAMQTVYLVAVGVILWQSHGLQPDPPTVVGHLLVCLRVAVVLCLVYASVKLFFSLKDFYSHLHNENYIPSPDKERRLDAEVVEGGGGGGDDERTGRALEDDDFEEFCRREGFPLPERVKAEPPGTYF